jgi:hypothetical protein
MHIISRLVFILVTAAGLLLAADCVAQASRERGDPSVNLPCPECGFIFDIREVKRERESARNLPLGTASSGWTIRFTPGDNADPHPHVDLVGSKAMRDALVESVWVVVVRFDDNRFQRIEMTDAAGLKIGDRVHVHQNRIEPDDRDLP